MRQGRDKTINANISMGLLVSHLIFQKIGMTVFLTIHLLDLRFVFFLR